MGVWIETHNQLKDNLEALSHPSWVCGLKLSSDNGVDVDATSHPSWVCGLKLYHVALADTDETSHPSWVCGLKLWCQRDMV